MSLIIRPAQPGDRADVFAFCARHDGDDYVLRVWDEWLADRQGSLLVATWEGTPVGLARTVFPVPGEAWLEGMRVDPGHREKGIATAIFEAQVEEAAGRGVHVARLMTAWDNLPVHRMCARLGFRRVLRLRRRFRPLEEGAPPRALRTVTPAELPLARALLSRQRRSPGFLALSAGLYSLAGGVWTEWNEGWLREHLARGEVWTWEQGQPGAIAVVCPHRRRPGVFEVGLLEGPAGACTALLRALACRPEVPAGETGTPAQVRLFLPLEAGRLQTAAATAGYRFLRGWRGEMWVFERQWV